MFEQLRGIIIEEPRNYHNLFFEYPKTNLYEVYNKGWWITEIFGSWAVIVRISSSKTRKLKRPYFICTQSQIDTTQITPEAQKIINQVKEENWNKYKHYILGTEYEQ